MYYLRRGRWFGRVVYVSEIRVRVVYQDDGWEFYGEKGW